MAKKALLVGINDYQGISDLGGCINDVTNMRNILKNFQGFTNHDIRVLVDNRATKDNIIFRLEKMVNAARKGDYIVFHFSGHGSQIRDRDADELKDHLDELICPYDMNWDDGFITDDTLNGIFTKLRQGVFLEVFLDCCHSGDGLRGGDFGRPAELGPENPINFRYIPPPMDIVCRYEGEGEEDEDDLKDTRKFRSRDKSTIQHVLWAGCKDNQKSADAYIDGSYNGAFTYYYCKHFRDTGGNVSRKGLIRRVRSSLRHNGYSQIPQLECKATVRDKKV